MSLFVILAVLFAAQQALAADPKNKIVVSEHGDEGPADRYATPYTPIVYGHRTAAPLPGLARAYELHDWDGDGRMDVLALLRRGGGLVVHRNVGEPGEPRFTEPRRSQRVMDASRVGSGFEWYAAADLSGDGTVEIVCEIDLPDDRGEALAMFINDGSAAEPDWRRVIVRDASGEPFDCDGYFALGDVTADGRADLIITSFDESDATDIPKRGRRRLMRFPPPDKVNPDVGRVWIAENISGEGEPPTFAEPVELQADGKPVGAYLRAYAAAVDLDGDGRNELIIGGQNNALRVFERKAEGAWTERGRLADPDGRPIDTSMAVRVQPADFGEGLELVSSGYFGNNGRYVRYRRDPDDNGPVHHGWRRIENLLINAQRDTPVYGLGNSTVDVVDLDGDGADDLLLGAEPGVPMYARNVGTNAEPKYEGPFRLHDADGSPVETRSIQTSPTVGSFWGPDEWYSDRLAPRAVDWDGDGVLDIVTGSMGRRLYFFKGVKVDGKLHFNRPANFRRGGEELDLPDRLLPGVVDWNDDGVPDLILSNDAGHVLMYPGDGSLDLGQPLRLGDIVLEDFWQRKKGNRSGFDVADWNGDGRRDLVIYQFHRGVFLFAGRGDNRFGDEQRLVKLYSHLAGPTVYDYDRDGVLDLVIGGDERRMIEPSLPAHLIYVRGQDVAVPPRR